MQCRFPKKLNAMLVARKVTLLSCASPRDQVQVERQNKQGSSQDYVADTLEKQCFQLLTNN